MQPHDAQKQDNNLKTSKRHQPSVKAKHPVASSAAICSTAALITQMGGGTSYSPVASRSSAETHNTLSCTWNSIMVPKTKGYRLKFKKSFTLCLIVQMLILLRLVRLCCFLVVLFRLLSPRCRALKEARHLKSHTF